MSVEIPQGTYNRNVGPDREGSNDAAATRRYYERFGADAASQHVHTELEAARRELFNDPEALERYTISYVRGLRGNDELSNLLPKLALSYGLQNGDVISHSRWRTLSGEQVLDPQKIEDRLSRSTNQLEREMFRHAREFYDNFKRQNESSWNVAGYGQRPLNILGGAIVPVSQAREAIRETDRTRNNREEMSVLATDRKLYESIARGGDSSATQDNRISRQDLNNFRRRWDENRDDFRRQFTNGDVMQEEKITIALNALRRQWESQTHANAQNRDGSILQNHMSDSTLYNWTGLTWAASDGEMTHESLARGLGFNNLETARRQIPAADRARGDQATGQSPMSGVRRESNFDNTRLNGRNEGPWHVARRMLQGQEEFFRNAPGGIEKAHRDLTAALGVRAGIHNSRQGANQLTEDNINKVIENINRANNPALRDWLISRYPGAGQRAESRTEAAANYDDSRYSRTSRHPQKIAENMTRGSEVATDQRAMRALQDVIRQHVRGRRDGENVLHSENYDAFKRAIEEKNNQALTAWFRRRYPEPRR